MCLRKWSKVDRYITSLFIGPDPALDSALKRSAASGLPMINVSANQGKLLHLIARAQRATKILEIGTLGGYSTIWLARALPKDGQLITLEASPKHAKVASRNIERAGLSRVVEIRLGKAQETLPRLVKEKQGPFDLIFIDADKPAYPYYLEWSLKLSHQGTLIVADNIVREGEVVNESSQDPNVQGVRKFNKLLATEKRATATAIQMVGVKGWDGFALALVTDE